MNEFNKLFPNITVEPEFYLSAFYGGTHDGLPIIGMYEEFQIVTLSMRMEIMD